MTRNRPATGTVLELLTSETFLQKRARPSLVFFTALVLFGLVNPVGVAAQQPARIARIGYLGNNVGANQEAFVEGLRTLGYVDGRNILIEYRNPAGRGERLPALADELVALKVDLIVAPGTPYALAAKDASRTIPIVFVSLDALSSGLVTNLARPGGNLTGLSALVPDLVGKCLEYLKQAVPHASRVAVLQQPGAYPELTEKEMRRNAEVAARALGVRLQFIDARRPADIDRAFSEMTNARVDALTVLTSLLLIRERQRIVDLTIRYRLPAVYSISDYIDAGALMVYGPNVPDLHRRAATYVGKILEGARPSDLPVEQPTKFELVVNRKAAHAIGLTIPPSLLGRADRVVEK